MEIISQAHKITELQVKNTATTKTKIHKYKLNTNYLR